MNYQRQYNILVTKRQQSSLGKNEYCELHHIVPRCMGGNDDPNNLVPLTPREHFIAHMLLFKIHPNVPGLFFACWRMLYDRDGRKINSRHYDLLKRHFRANARHRDRSFMRTDSYRDKQSRVMKHVWANSPQRKQVHAARLKAATCKRVDVGGMVFDSITACALHFNISVEGVRRRIRVNTPGWSYAL